MCDCFVSQDLGQKTFGHVTCKVCGMVYTYGQADDRSEHYKFHRKFLSGVKFPVSLHSGAIIYNWKKWQPKN